MTKSCGESTLYALLWALVLMGRTLYYCDDAVSIVKAQPSLRALRLVLSRTRIEAGEMRYDRMTDPYE